MILIDFMRKNGVIGKNLNVKFEHYCKGTRQMFATLDSRTVDRQNTRLSADTVKYATQPTSSMPICDLGASIMERNVHRSAEVRRQKWIVLRTLRQARLVQVLV